MSTLNLTPADDEFKKYVKHVLRWEGFTSKDPVDTAASCAPFAGAYHTNRGVTYCTFKKVAASIGILPVTYDRFINLTDDDVAKFVFHFTSDAQADDLPTLVAISVTEAAWGSGPHRAICHLQDALNVLGMKIKVDGDMGPSTRAAVAKVNAAELYKEYWDQRLKYIGRLVIQAKYKKYANGWRNRIMSFFEIFGRP